MLESSYNKITFLFDWEENMIYIKDWKTNLKTAQTILIFKLDILAVI